VASAKSKKRQCAAFNENFKALPPEKQKALQAHITDFGSSMSLCGKITK
jgi:hypothetical protein